MMKKNGKSKGSFIANNLLEELGFDELGDFPLEDFVYGLGATYIEEPLKNSDGRIVFGKKRALIKINSDIAFKERKRFATAHEIGHFVMHKGLKVHNDNSKTLSWFKESEFKKGQQELEANEFAAELLMPTLKFYEEAKGKHFSPELLSSLANRFQTSITSTAFRYIQFPLHPIFIAFISDGVVKYWKKSDSLKVWVKDLVKCVPPENSVAQEYIDGSYEFIYSGEEKKQIIDKSTWFELTPKQEDSTFYEYCIPTKSHRTILSVIWEE